MIMLDNTTALVYDTDDLREAVSSDNGVEYVYFGADITLDYGVTIYPNKPSLVFDGTYEGVRYTFTDMDSLAASNTLGVRTASNITITFQNINLIGRNYYGIPYVPNVSSYNGVSTIYHNVVYNGVQMIHNPYGFARITDCDVTLTYQEAGEINRLEIGGVTTITKTNDANAVFWFYGTGALRAYMKILSGADVMVTTANYFMYETSPPDYIIEPGASFTLNTNSGIAYTSSHTIESFLVGENASFRYTQASNRGYATLYLDGVLTVNEGASFYMQTDFINTNGLIRFNGGSDGLRLYNPKSFALYNRGTSSAAAAFYFVSTTPFEITGGQVNYWSEARTFPIAGTFDDMPARKWKRPDWSAFTLRGTAGTAQTNVDYNDFTQEELDLLPPLADLQLHSAQVFSVGNLPLAVNAVVTGGPVTGKTEPYANVKAEYSSGGTPYTDIVVADSTGAFVVPAPYPIPFATLVMVYANTPFLTVWVEKFTEEEELVIENAPEDIRFITPPLTGFLDVILPRHDPNGEVVVRDTRIVKTRWTLWGSIEGPLKTDENDVLDKAVVFADPGGEMIALGAAPEALQTYEVFDGDTTTVRWDADKGVLARIRTPIRSGKAYSTRMHWEVYPEGVIPEGRG